MNHLIEDLVILISTYCDDRSNYNLSQVCRNTYNATSKGFMRHICFDYLKDNVTTFTERFYRHRRSITSCSMTYVENAFLWLPFWVENVYMSNCRITQVINPRQNVSTKRLRICSLGTKTQSLYINWRKFPQLEEVDIINYDVNCDGLEDCKLLKRICFYSKSGRNNEIPQSVCNIVNQNNSICQ